MSGAVVLLKMASPVQVKHEPGGIDLFHAATESEAEEIDIDMDNLQPLAPKFAASSKFPVGCKVWCNLRRSFKTECRLAKSASVLEVYIHVENGRRVYRVKSETTTQYEQSLYEDQLVYAINCPVNVTNVDTKEMVDGFIIYPELPEVQNGVNMKQNVSYVVQYLEENRVRIEHGVAAERIKYRSRSVCVDKHSGVEGAGKVDTKHAAKEKNEIEIATEKGLPELRVARENDKAVPTLALNQQVGTSSAKSAEVTSRKSAVNKKGSEPLTASTVITVGKKAVENGLTQSPSAVSLSHTDSNENGHKELDKWDSLVDKRLTLPSRKTSSGPDLNERPNKLAKKTESVGIREVECTLEVPPWIKQVRGQDSLFHKLFVGGVNGNGGKGYKKKHIESKTNCSIDILGLSPMRIRVST